MGKEEETEKKCCCYEEKSEEKKRRVCECEERRKWGIFQRKGEKQSNSVAMIGCDPRRKRVKKRSIQRMIEKEREK